jgi:hypothetical protein
MKSISGFSWFLALLFIFAVTLFFRATEAGPGISPRAIARNDVVQIATAITVFETEYGLLPSTNAAAQDVGGPILQALMGSNTTLNPKKIVFLEVRPAEKKLGGLQDGFFVDPWGSPYRMKFDTDYDNKVQNVGPSQDITAEVTKKVAVWNDPSTHADGATQIKKQKRLVTSWE